MEAREYLRESALVHCVGSLGAFRWPSDLPASGYPLNHVVHPYMLTFRQITIPSLVLQFSKLFPQSLQI